MLAVISRQLAHWKHGDVRDVHEEILQYTGETICAVLFGESFTNERRESEAAVSTVFGGLHGEIFYLLILRRLPLKKSRAWNH
jgi:hypothetical protein